MVGDEFIEEIRDVGRILENMIEAEFTSDAEEVGCQGMVTEVVSDRGVVDQSLDAESTEVGFFSNTRQLEDLSSANRASRKNDFFASTDGDWSIT